jgi:hypothetical protein
MSEKKPSEPTSTSANGTDYEPPAVEEVVTRDALEREVAYAGVPGPSQITN